MTAMLDFKDVELYYDHVYALKGVSLNVNQGETVALIGANGAEKTTLVKMLAGIIHPTAGSARVLGFDPWEREDAFRRQIALIMGQKPPGRTINKVQVTEDVRHCICR